MEKSISVMIFVGAVGVFFNCVILWADAAELNANSVTLSPGNGSELEIIAQPNTITQVMVKDLSASVTFVSVEVHSHLYNVTLSYNVTLTPGYFAIGTNVGLILGAGAGQVPLSSPVYLTNKNNQSVQVLLMLQAYDSNAPIPGGCNMEVSIKTAPFLPTSFSQNVLTVEYPLGSWPLNVRPATCDRAPLQYDIYEYYLPERDVTSRTAFDSLRMMTGVSSVEKNGRKISFSGNPPSKIKFANYAGTGRIVSVIVRTLTTSSSYVPALSYGCNVLSENEEDNCQVLSSTGPKLLTAFLVFVGLFLTIFGHRFYKSQLFLLGFCASAILFYVILISFVEVAGSVAGMTATSVGAVGGAMWLALWARWGAPIAPIFLAAFLLGILFASTVTYTPLADYPILKDDATFWLAFFCLVLVVPLAVLSFSKLTSILWCTVGGSFIFIVPVDHYVGSNLKYIILNTLRRATDSEFGTAIVDPPFQTPDIILTVTWAVLSASGTAFQWWREKGRAPFPPAPTWSFRRRPTTTTDDTPTEATHLLS